MTPITLSSLSSNLLVRVGKSVYNHFFRAAPAFFFNYPLKELRELPGILFPSKTVLCDRSQSFSIDVL